MNIDKTPLDFEIKRVFESDFIPNNARYTGQFKIGDQLVDVLKIVDIDVVDDYEMSYASVMMLRAMVLIGDYGSFIFPNKDNLEFILKTEMSNPYTNVTADGESVILVKTYNVSLDPTSRPFMSEDNNNETMSRLEQNLLGPVEIDFQLKTKLSDDVSKMQSGGHIIDSTNADALRDLLTHFCSKLELDDVDRLKGVNLSGTTSTVVNKSIMIPHGLPLSDLGDYLQNSAGGIYPAGLAQFIDDGIWYVYPPYDTTGFDDAKEKMVIISVPAKRYPNVEKTYVVENGIVTVLATGNKRIRSDKQQIFDNAGNGVVVADANKMVTGFSSESGNTSVIRRGDNNSEFISEEVPNGKNNVRMAPERISSNPFVVRSRLARSQGHFFTIEWQNADPTLIKPNMHVKVLYLNDGEVREITGVLIKCHRQTKINGFGMMATGYRNFCVLEVFVKTNPNEDSGLLGLT